MMDSTDCDEARPLDAEVEQTIAGMMTEASLFRLLSVVFRPPSAGLSDQILGLSEPLPEALKQRAKLLASNVDPELEHDYHRVLGAGSKCPVTASDYAANQLGGKGALMGDVSAFYAAFGFDPGAELKDCQDHIAIELSFMAWLLTKTAYALFLGRTDWGETCFFAMHSFRREHLDWLPRFCDKLAETAGGGFYEQAGELLRSSCSGEFSARGSC